MQAVQLNVMGGSHVPPLASSAAEADLGRHVLVVNAAFDQYPLPQPNVAEMGEPDGELVTVTAATYGYPSVVRGEGGSAQGEHPKLEFVFGAPAWYVYTMLGGHGGEQPGSDDK